MESGGLENNRPWFQSLEIKWQTVETVTFS